MARRQVVFWVDEEILRRFDVWRMDRHKPSRAAALGELMAAAVSKPREKPPEPKPVVEDKKRTVIAELRSGLQRVRTECEHLNRSRLANYGMWKCEDCGHTWR